MGLPLHNDEHRAVLLNKCAGLSPREKEVLRGLGQRRRAKEIARDLKISEHTVRGYANDARQKLGLTSLRDAAVLFLEFEAAMTPPQNQGDHFQRVANHLSNEPSLKPGQSNALPQGPFPDPVGPQVSKASAFPELGRYDRLARLHAWLARLSLARWAGLTVVLTLGVIMAFGLAAVTVLGVFEVLQQIGGLHR